MREYTNHGFPFVFPDGREIRLTLKIETVSIVSELNIETLNSSLSSSKRLKVNGRMFKDRTHIWS